MKFRVNIFITIIIIFNAIVVNAMPPWIKKVPQGKYNIYSVGLGESYLGLSDAMKKAVANAINSFPTEDTLKISGKTILEKTEINMEYNSKFIQEIIIENESKIIPGIKMLERYTETGLEGDGKYWRAWVLLSFPMTSDYSLTSVVARSAVLPGWGQFYRGSKTKGFVFSFGEIATIGGAIFTAVRQNDFEKKAANSLYQANRDYYYDQADKYHQANVIFVSTAVGLYVLNLTDAIFSSSNKADIYYSSFRIEPILDRDFNLIVLLTYNR